MNSNQHFDLPQEMNALFCEAYGNYQNIQVKSCPLPTIAADEILVQTIASSITRADSLMRSGTPKFGRLFLGWKKPKQPKMGTGFSGRVIAKGKDVTHFDLLDEVFGETATSFGANAEFISIKEDAVVVKKPDYIDHQSAALLCDGPVTSYNFLHHHAQVQEGSSILINGASGSLGSAAIQIAKAKGALVVGRSHSKNKAKVLAFGVDEFRAYDLEGKFKDSSKDRYDVIYDPAGKFRFSDAASQLTPKGRLLSPVLSMGFLRDVICTGLFSQKKAKFEATGLKKAREIKTMIAAILTLIEDEKLFVPIERAFELNEAKEAHRLIDEGKKHGNFVLAFER
jgi:NADPH:quinone reductase-like Zn-dependent oxidoreductase